MTLLRFDIDIDCALLVPESEGKGVSGYYGGWVIAMLFRISKHKKGHSGPRVRHLFGPNICEVIGDPASDTFLDRTVFIKKKFKLKLRKIHFQKNKKNHLKKRNFKQKNFQKK